MDFVVPADYWVSLKESENRDMCLDLAREQKKKTMEYESNADIIIIGTVERYNLSRPKLMIKTKQR